MWSLGVTLFLMLGGYHLFDGSRESDAARRDTTPKLDAEFKRAPWAGVSAQARELVRALLAPAAAERLGAAGVLGHEWMRAGPEAHLLPPPPPVGSLTASLLSAAPAGGGGGVGAARRGGGGGGGGEAPRREATYIGVSVGVGGGGGASMLPRREATYGVPSPPRSERGGGARGGVSTRRDAPPPRR
jgi:hypothetical protein